MKRQYLISVGIALLVLLCASMAVSQDLGELARQEKARRAKQTKKPAKTYTNENMPARPPGEGPTAAASISPSPEGLEAPPSQAPPPNVPIPGAPAIKPPEDEKKGTKEMWQGRFKSARAQITAAEDAQRLSEDELSLLQIQQARELDPDTQRDLEGKIKDKNAEVAAQRAQTDKAKKALEALDKEFKESGAPAAWAKTD
ncbi:MAG: hypothetical protein ACE145_15595 [Terriglobia bacterium]